MRPRLTFANAVSVLALFVALGGASYAAFKVPKNSVGTKQLKKNAVTTAKIKKEAVTAARVRKNALTGTQINEDTLSVVPSATTAVNASNASNAINSINAATAKIAESAQPIAFAHVNADGTLDAANSKNVGVVDHSTAKGVYCFGGLPFTPRGGLAIPDAFGNGSTAQFGLGVGCNAGPADEAFVDIFNVGDEFENAPFFVVFYG